MNPNFFNLSHKKNKDLLSELLTLRTSEGTISKQELHALMKVIGEASHPGPGPNNHPGEKRKISPREKGKTGRKRITCYLSDEISRNLDSATREIRSFLPENLQARITRSHVVDKALALMLKEYKDRGKKSRLARSVLHLK